MSAWFSAHAAAFRVALRQAAAGPVATLLAVVALAAALSLPLAAWVVVAGLEAIGAKYDAAPRITAYLPKGAGAKERAAVEQAIRARAGVRRVVTVTKEQALAELQATEGVRDLLVGLAGNPLPDALVITPGDSTVAAIDALRGELARIPGVAEVEIDGAWVSHLEALVAAARAVTAGLATLLAVAVVAVTFNTVRLQVLGRARELEVAALFGATGPWLRRPFLHFGALQGVVSGMLATALAGAFAAMIERGLGKLAGVAALGANPFRLHWEQALTCVVVAALLGWSGAFLSVREHARRR